MCPICIAPLHKKLSSTFYVTTGMQPTMADRKEEEHKKKVKDPERAVRMRKKAFGKDSVGDPSMQVDPKHIIKKGKTIGGQQMEVDKKDFIKAAAKDPLIVKQASEIVKKQRN